MTVEATATFCMRNTSVTAKRKRCSTGCIKSIPTTNWQSRSGTRTLRLGSERRPERGHVSANHLAGTMGDRPEDPIATIDTAVAETVTHGMTEVIALVAAATGTEMTATKDGKTTEMTEVMAGPEINSMGATTLIEPGPKSRQALHSSSVITRQAAVGTPNALVTAETVKTTAEMSVVVDVVTSAQETTNTAHVVVTTGIQEAVKEKAGNSRTVATKAGTTTTIKEVMIEGVNISRIVIGPKTNAVTDVIMTTAPATETGTGTRTRVDKREKVRLATQDCLSVSGWLA